MQITDKEYSDHKIFDELKSYADFYDLLSGSIMSFVSMGTSAITFDTYVFTSMQGTIESISLLLKNGRMNDAYALLRKYHDSIIINAYEIAYLEDNFDIDNFIVEKIEKWLQGTEKLPMYNPMKQYIENKAKLKDINKVLSKDRRYTEIRDRCNNHMHYNFFANMLLNDNQVYNKERINILNELSNDMTNLFILHFAYLFTLNPHYMASSDYLDSLEAGFTPTEGSQYYVAPFIQGVFDSIVKVHRNDIADVMKAEGSMQLE